MLSKLLTLQALTGLLVSGTDVRDVLLNRWDKSSKKHDVKDILFNKWPTGGITNAARADLV